MPSNDLCLLPRHILLWLMLRAFMTKYSDGGVSGFRSIRGQLSELALHLMPEPSEQILDIYDQIVKGSYPAASLDALTQLTQAYPVKQELLQNVDDVPIESAGDSWLIQELLWYWLDWYRNDCETHQDPLTWEYEWAKAAYRLTPIRLIRPHFEIDLLNYEARNRIAERRDNPYA